MTVWTGKWAPGQVTVSLVVPVNKIDNIGRAGKLPTSQYASAAAQARRGQPLPPRLPKENAQPDSMAIQSDGLLYRLAQPSRAARTCCQRLEYSLSAVNEENAIKLRTELNAWEAASEEEEDLGVGVPGKRRTREARAEGSGGGLEEIVREYPALMGNACLPWWNWSPHFLFCSIQIIPIDWRGVGLTN